MKQVGLCQECGRNVYTNDIDLCKRCHNEVGIEILKQQVVEEPEEEAGPSLEELGIEASEEETSEDEETEEPQEETKEKKKD